MRIGDVELRILRPMERCVMVTMPQIGLPEERGLLARIGEANETNLGLVAEVVAPGRMRVGDPVVLEPRARRVRRQPAAPTHHSRPTHTPPTPALITPGATP